jgi:hypothetical protein
MASHKYLTLEGLSFFKDNIMSIIEDNELTIAAALNRIPLDISNRVQTAVSNMIQPASALQYELTKENNSSGSATGPRAFYMLVNNKTTDTGDYFNDTGIKSYDTPGILTSTMQTIAGEKQFANNIRILNNYEIDSCSYGISYASTGYIYFGNPEWQIKNDAYISYGLSSPYECDLVDVDNLDTSLSIRNKNSQITLKRNNIAISTNVSLPSNKTIKIGDVNVSLEGHTHEFTIDGNNGTLETILSNLSSSLNTHISTGSHVLPYSSGDINKVLGVAAGTDGTTPTLSWVPGLPTYNTTNDKDKYLHIKDDGNGFEWASLPEASKTSSGIVSQANQAFNGMKTFWGGLRTNIISAKSTDSSISSKLYVQDVKDLYLQFVNTPGAVSTKIHLTNTNLYVDGATYDKAIKIAGNYVYLNGQIMINDTPIEDLLSNTDLPIASGFHIPDYDGQGSNYFLEQTMSAGILTTERQSIAGEKHFNDGIRLVNAIATGDGEDTYGGVYAINPDNHTDTPKISFGYGNKTYIWSTPLYCPSDEYPTQKFDKSDSVLCINSPGFNVLRTNSDIDDTLSITFEESKNNSGTYSPAALQHYSSGNGKMLRLGQLTTASGSLLTIDTSALSTSYANIYPQKTYNLSGFLGGETLVLDFTNATIPLKLGLSKNSATTTSAVYNINAGAFLAYVRVYYKFDNQVQYTELTDVSFSATLNDQGIRISSTTLGTGTGTSVTLTSNRSTVNLNVPEGATSCTLLFNLCTPNTTSSDQSNSSLSLRVGNIEIGRDSSGTTRYYAYDQGYKYLYTATTSQYAIQVKGITYKTTNYKNKGIPYSGLTDILNTGGVNIVNSVMYGDQYTKFNKFDSLDSHILKSSIIISTPQAKDGSPGYLNAFNKMQDNKIELCSDYGYVQLTSLGLHQKTNAFTKAGGGHLLITTKNNSSHIIFGCINETNILHKIKHGEDVSDPDCPYCDPFYPFEKTNITLRPCADGYGYLGNSSNNWYYIYSCYGEFSQNVKAKTFIQSSDAELKTIKGDVDVDLDRLKEIPKIFFKYNEDDDNITRIGTIAQDVQKIYPEIVHTDEDGHLSLEYDKLSVISLKAIDKLYDRQIELENEIKELKEIVLKILK